MLSAAELGITTMAFTAGKRLVKIDKVRYVGLLGLIGQARQYFQRPKGRGLRADVAGI